MVNNYSDHSRHRDQFDFCFDWLLYCECLARHTTIEFVGPNLVFCCSSAPQIPLAAGVTDRQKDGRRDGHNKGAQGLLLLSD